MKMLVLEDKKILDNSVKREIFKEILSINYRGLDKANENDLILLSDLDEIPNLSTFKFRNKITFFKQNVYYYKFNLMQPSCNLKWMGTS